MGQSHGTSATVLIQQTLESHIYFFLQIYWVYGAVKCYQWCLPWIMIKNKHRKHNEWMSPSWVERNGTRRGKATYGRFQISFQAWTKDQAAPGRFTFLNVCRALFSEGLGFTQKDHRMTRTIGQHKHGGKDDNHTLLFSLQIIRGTIADIMESNIWSDRFLCYNLFINH